MEGKEEWEREEWEFLLLIPILIERRGERKREKRREGRKERERAD